MKRNIRKVAVLGSGIMGSGIACHLANVGIEVLLLDIVPKDFENSENKEKRNSIVNNALKASLKSKPSPIYVILNLFHLLKPYDNCIGKCQKMFFLFILH